MPSVKLILIFFQYFPKRYIKHLYRLLLLVFLKFKLIHPIFTSVWSHQEEREQNLWVKARLKMPHY